MRSQDLDDWQLLNEYATQNSEGAFRALVDRHGGMVYHAALRQTADPYLAEEVTQAVFIALAQKAARISRSVLICGWLFRATRYAVLNLTRAERSRRRHEHEAVVMQTTQPSPDQTHPVWEHISPFLDEALADLSAADREAILVRYFNNKSHKETGSVLGISEDAAKKRLSRALDKLRGILGRRGLVVPALALTTAFGASAAKAAPAGLAASAAGAAVSHAAGGLVSSPVIASGILTNMAQAKAKTVAIVAVAAVVLALITRNFLTRSPTAPAAPEAVTTAPAQAPASPSSVVVWDNHLAAPPSLNAPDAASLELALNTMSVQAGAYWSVDYVVYDSDDALRQLLDAFRNGGTLSSCGWTNLGGAKRKLGTFNVVNASSVSPGQPAPDPMNTAQAPNAVAMTAVVRDDPADSAELSSEKQRAMQESIERAMREGLAEGVLAPERLLADLTVVPRLTNLTAVAANRATAARLAHDAHAFWTIIYTMRKSPLAGVGIKLAHDAPPPGEDPPPLQTYTQKALLGGLNSDMFDLTPAEIAAHDQAVNGWLNQQAGVRKN